MKIQFERSGGFTAIPLRFAVDTDQLEPSLAAELIRLVDESQFTHLADQVDPLSEVRDQFHYRLTIDHQGSSHTVETGDSNTPEGLRPLLRQLTLLARSGRLAS